MCVKEHPVVNTDAACLCRPTDFLWGPSQELVLESAAAASTFFSQHSPHKLHPVTHHIRVMLNSNISSWHGFFLIPSAWPTYIKRMDSECHSETSFFLGFSVAYSLPYFNLLTPTNQLFRKHTLLPRTDHKKNNTSGWMICCFNSVMTENMIRAIWGLLSKQFSV